MVPDSQSKVLRLPCVVQLGFAGSRHWIECGLLSADMEVKLAELLRAVIRSLPEILKLEPHHFLCGISQLAIGADTLFTRTCAAEGIPQRLFLPQPHDVFLSAMALDGTPDFTDDENQVAAGLLGSPHLIQERVVSVAADRPTRFQDVNSEIVRVSDVLIGLTRENASTTPGGTRDFIRLAIEGRKPTLELQLVWTDGVPRLEETWHNLDHFNWLPELPEEVAEIQMPVGAGQRTLPTVAMFCDAVKAHTSQVASKSQATFSRAAIVIIGTHILATLFATLALALHGSHSEHDATIAPPFGLISLLVMGVGLLSWGYATHQRLHHAEATGTWALNRLLAEINRSVMQIGPLHMYLDYLFHLRLPNRFRPLLRTINVLHLSSTRIEIGTWQSLREMYLRQRLTDVETGQITYYERRAHREERLLVLFRCLFQMCSALATTATAIKVGVLLKWLPTTTESESAATGLLGLCAVVLPVMAVGVMSWSAAMDYAARVNTYQKTAAWLRTQCDEFKLASSQSEFQRLVSETEFGLIGETAEWYLRRSFTSVT